MIQVGFNGLKMMAWFLYCQVALLVYSLKRSASQPLFLRQT